VYGRQVHTRRRLLYALFTRTVILFKSPIKDTMDEAKQYECMTQELGPEILSKVIKRLNSHTGHRARLVRVAH
jgi:hypothetical protein